jgi:hypothetical protein
MAMKKLFAALAAVDTVAALGTGCGSSSGGSGASGGAITATQCAQKAVRYPDIVSRFSAPLQHATDEHRVNPAPRRWVIL